MSGELTYDDDGGIARSFGWEPPVTLGRPIHRVEVTASPTGKNVHVFVDGVPYVPEAAQR